MEKVEAYTPEIMEFVLDAGTDPEVICELDSFDDPRTGAQRFITNTFTAFNEAAKVERIMDEYELTQAREAYRVVLEDELPELEKASAELDAAAHIAKERAKQAQDLYQATITKIKDLAHVAKMGVTDHHFAANECWKVPVGKKYRYYAICGNLLRLVKIEDIPEYAQRDILNSMNQNEFAYNSLNLKTVAV
jgi:hypothetical protein